MKLNLNDLKKLESSTVGSLALDPQGRIEAVVKVKEPHYIPKNVHVRAQIGPLMVTCEFDVAELKSLEEDPNVESVAVNKRLRGPN